VYSITGYLTDHTTRKGPPGFWTVEYYQPYFDVDTSTVLKRCYTTLLPTSPSYLTIFTPGADLYGPFWIPTTLVLALFLSSSLAASISSYLSAPGAAYEYDFGLLSLAATIVYIYTFAVPVLLWLALRYFGVGEWSVVEALGVWGYSLFVWIPVSVRTRMSQLRCTVLSNHFSVDTMRHTSLYFTLGSGGRRVLFIRVFPGNECVPNIGDGMVMSLT
jgi:hypothetical protein